MKLTISKELLHQFSKFVSEQMGLYFLEERFGELENRIVIASQEFGFKNVETFIKWLISHPLTKNQIEALACHLTVGETYFFREKSSLDVLKEYVLPELITSCQKDQKHLTIWSAGCCTGEEPYSLAILLYEMTSRLNLQNITILATDINPAFLKRASEGVYSEWSFRNIDSCIKEKYFKKKKENQFEVLPHIKKMVVFSYLNLANKSFFPLINNNSIDIVLCRNVLMYFALEQAKEAVKKIFSSLVEGGWLIVSPSELSQILFPQFTTINFSKAILYKKENKQDQELSFFPENTIGQIITPYNISETITSLPKYQSNENTFNDKSFFVFEDTVQKTLELAEQNTYIQAQALYEQGIYQETIEKLLTISTNNSNHTQTLILLARAYANQGKLDKAIEWCQKAIAINKLDEGCYYLLATIFQENKQITEAIAALNSAIYINPNFVLAHFSLATLALEQEKYKNSDKHFENALLLLEAYKQEELLPYSDWLTAGRLKEIIQGSYRR